MKYFVYFSASGNGDFIAEYLKELGYTPIKVEMIKPIKKINFFSIMKYGFRAGTNKKEKIKELNLDLNDNDEVIIGSPIGNGSTAPPLMRACSISSASSVSTFKMFLIQPTEMVCSCLTVAFNIANLSLSIISP